MSPQFIRRILAVATIIITSAVPVVGHTEPAADLTRLNIAAVEAAGITPAGVAGAALELAAFGRSSGDPTILVAAARTLRLVGEMPGTGTVRPGPDVPGDVKPGATVTDADAANPAVGRDLAGELLDEARLLARGDETVLAAIDQVMASATRGSTTGAGRYDLSLEPRDGMTIDEQFRGLELAEVTMIGDGSSDLDLVVVDQNGNTICEQAGPEPRGRCRWTPAWEGLFEIRVLNSGQVPSAAVVLVN